MGRVNIRPKATAFNSSPETSAAQHSTRFTWSSRMFSSPMRLGLEVSEYATQGPFQNWWTHKFNVLVVATAYCIYIYTYIYICIVHMWTTYEYIYIYIHLYNIHHYSA